MDAPKVESSALNAAIARLLRPLCRLMLRHGMSFGVFEELAKRVYVDVAMTDFAIAGKKPSISRASILSGLTRKEVQRLAAVPTEAATAVDQRYNRAARVLTGWISDRDFTDAKGQPRTLPIEGDHGLAALVRRHSGDMPVRAVLDELVRVGAVRLRADGSAELVARAYVPSASAVDKLGILGNDVADLVDTIDHNLAHGASDPRFQRKVMYHEVPAEAVPAFRRLSASEAQALLERLDAWLRVHGQTPAEADDARTPARTVARVGLGIYYFEERMPPSKPTGDAS